MIDKKKVFSEDVEKICNENIRRFVYQCLCELPDYFFTTAASSTGKYHPSYSLGDGGLVRHTKAAVKIGAELLRLEQYRNQFNELEQDCILAAIILHDGMKHGLNGSKYTVAEHPTVMANYLLDIKTDLENDIVKLISDNIASHMGEFNTDFKTKKEILPKPQTESQKFVHLCDYLASRKYLTVDFDSYYQPKNYEVNKLNDLIDEIIAVCKTKIGAGVDREDLYAKIEEVNGNKNPRAIKDESVAQEILNLINQM